MKVSRKHKMLLLYNRYEQSVYNIAYNILKNVEQAEDITQDVFLKIYKYIDDITDVDSSRTAGLVATISKNSAIDKYRENKKMVEYNDELYEQSDNDPAIIIENQIEELYYLDILEEELREMPPAMKEIIEMRYGYNLKMSEIADVLGIKSSTVRKRFERAKKYLINRFYERGIKI